MAKIIIFWGMAKEKEEIITVPILRKYFSIIRK